jgi:hypothetical protein
VKINQKSEWKRFLICAPFRLNRCSCLLSESGNASIPTFDLFSQQMASTRCIFITTPFRLNAPSSSLLQGKHLPFSSSPLRLNIFRLFVILSLTQFYRYTPEIFLFSTATFKYIYQAPLRQIGQE